MLYLLIREYEIQITFFFYNLVSVSMLQCGLDQMIQFGLFHKCISKVTLCFIFWDTDIVCSA